MRLFYNNLSPFARKVRILAHELGLADQIEMVQVAVSPVQPNRELSAFNPLMKVPTLVTDGAEVLFDSRVICEHLDGLHAGARYFPRNEPRYFSVARVHALADGILEAGILCLFEQRLRPAEIQFKPWEDGQRLKVQQGLDALERESELLLGAPSIAQVASAATLAWLQFRSIVPQILQDRPGLSKFYEAYAARPSMRETAPV